jgi:hypothetical protein
MKQTRMNVELRFCLSLHLVSLSSSTPLIPNHPPPRQPLSPPIPFHRSQTGLPTVEGYIAVITRRNTCYRITIIRWDKLKRMNYRLLTNSETPNCNDDYTVSRLDVRGSLHHSIIHTESPTRWNRI